MTDVFEGAPDARQVSPEEAPAPTSRFRPRYRQLTDHEKALHDEIKTKATELEALFSKVVASTKPAEAMRYHALAITCLEESVMWAVKGLTS